MQPGADGRARRVGGAAKWAADRGADGGAAASGTAARALWLALWGGLAVLSAWQAAAAPAALPRSIASMADGQPHVLALAGTALGSALSGHGALVSWALAAVLAVIAAAVFLPVSSRRAVMGAGAVLAVAVWTLGQGFGGLLTGMATDPNSGPLLLLALAAYWPVRAAANARAQPSPAPSRRLRPGRRPRPGRRAALHQATWRAGGSHAVLGEAGHRRDERADGDRDGVDARRG